jgi:DNA invertase Pin-like site-specific DNA recombinase
MPAYGCEKIFTNTASGKLADRPELDKALAYLREGDVFGSAGIRIKPAAVGDEAW